MKYDEFIKNVQAVAQLDTRADAERATQATLETIKERIVGDEAKDLASQLPAQLAQYLHGREGQVGDHFKLEEFIRRVSEKEGLEPSVAFIHARAVFSVLQDAVTPGEFADVRHNFSDDYDEIFASGISSASA